MEHRRVVITGIGVICSNAVGREAFWTALDKNTSGIKPISLFDTASFDIKVAGEIKDFAPQELLGPKGLRTLDRSTKLLCCAVKLALDDAAAVITEENTRDIGMVTGSSLGSIASVSDFDREAIQDGPNYVNPALFPNTVINSPSSQAAIKFNIKGFNATISTGFSSSLDAVNYAADFLRLGRAKMVLACGTEELCPQLFLAFSKTKLLKKENYTLGEGAGVIVLEDLDAALMRKAKIYAELVAPDVSSKETDAQVYNSLRPLIGECYSAAGILNLAGALGLVAQGKSGSVLVKSSQAKRKYSDLVITKFKG